ncbi:hypothetical protein IEQ34_019394 [Dendrobium chrysotoxum]|uniref:Uncharacterized protein n=1 Tax=Dendrobium chrysotoxum TaxID=161865 RepID=A0AAV7G7N5_DENCH|nr:hypothetical protein IEQ34_019394 [Dendrobium chrysotoxum]
MYHLPFLWILIFIQKKNSGALRAESNGKLAGVGAGKRRSGIIKSIAIRLRTSCLKHFGVRRRPTRRRAGKLPATAILRPPERIASAPASRRFALSNPQLRRAPLVQIHHTTRRCTPPLTPFHDHRQVESINKANVVEINIVPLATGERELGEGRRRCFARGAGAVVGVVENATGSGPEAAGPVGRGLEGARSIRREFEAGGGKRGVAGVGEDGRPDCEVAFVDEGEGGCRKGYGEEGGDEQENENGRIHF